MILQNQPSALIFSVGIYGMRCCLQNQPIWTEGDEMRQNVAHGVGAHLQGPGKAEEAAAAQAHELAKRVADRAGVCEAGDLKGGGLRVAGDIPGAAICFEAEVAGNAGQHSGPSGGRDLAVSTQEFKPAEAWCAGISEGGAEVSQRGVAVLQGALQLCGAGGTMPEAVW